MSDRTTDAFMVRSGRCAVFEASTARQEKLRRPEGNKVSAFPRSDHRHRQSHHEEDRRGCRKRKVANKVFERSSKMRSALPNDFRAKRCCLSDVQKSDDPPHIFQNRFGDGGRFFCTVLEDGIDLYLVIHQPAHLVRHR